MQTASKRLILPLAHGIVVLSWLRLQWSSEPLSVVTLELNVRMTLRLEESKLKKQNLIQIGVFILFLTWSGLKTDQFCLCWVMGHELQYFSPSPGLPVQLLKIYDLLKPTGKPCGAQYMMQCWGVPTIAPWFCSLPSCKERTFHSPLCSTVPVPPHTSCDTGSGIISWWCFPWLNSHLALALSPALVNRKCEQQWCLWVPLTFSSDVLLCKLSTHQHYSCLLSVPCSHTVFFCFPGDNSVRKLLH